MYCSRVTQRHGSVTGPHSTGLGLVYLQVLPTHMHLQVSRGSVREYRHPKSNVVQRQHEFCRPYNMYYDRYQVEKAFEEVSSRHLNSMSRQVSMHRRLHENRHISFTCMLPVSLTIIQLFTFTGLSFQVGAKRALLYLPFRVKLSSKICRIQISGQDNNPMSLSSRI